MKVIRTIAELRSELKDRWESGSGSVGLVPTMGYLHEGHASLMRKAREMAGTVVVSIFVNPIQFGPGEDYETYPRDEARDLALAESEGVNVIYSHGSGNVSPADQNQNRCIGNYVFVVRGLPSRPF